MSIQAVLRHLLPFQFLMVNLRLILVNSIPLFSLLQAKLFQLCVEQILDFMNSIKMKVKLHSNEASKVFDA